MQKKNYVVKKATYTTLVNHDSWPGLISGLSIAWTPLHLVFF
jgi:hypothetical protein